MIYKRARKKRKGKKEQRKEKTEKRYNETADGREKNKQKNNINRGKGHVSQFPIPVHSLRISVFGPWPFLASFLALTNSHKNC